MQTDWESDCEMFNVALTQANDSMSNLEEWLESASPDDLSLVINQDAFALYEQQMKVGIAAIQMLNNIGELGNDGDVPAEQIRTAISAGTTTITLLLKTVQRAVNLAIEVPKRSVGIQNKKKADEHHNRPGGSRENKEKIRQLWASGNYSSRAQCAFKECGRLNISQVTARRYLINTPEPIGS